jgi:hypothetical protein
MIERFERTKVLLHQGSLASIAADAIALLALLLASHALHACAAAAAVACQRAPCGHLACTRARYFSLPKKSNKTVPPHSFGANRSIRGQTNSTWLHGPGTRKRRSRTGPDRIFIGQSEATLVWGPETGANCNFEIPDQIVGP